MNRLKLMRLFICFVLICSAGIWNVSISSAATFATYPPVPEGITGFATPTIQLKISFKGLEMQRYQMYLNDSPVEAKFNEKLEVFLYTPPKALAPGNYHVKLEFQFKGYRTQEKSWDFTVSEDAITSFPAVTSEQNVALTAVNDYRIALGLSPVKLNDRLNAAAKAHADYLQANGFLEHTETPGNPNFVGQTITDRTRFFGYSNDILMEDISEQSSDSPIDAVDGLFDAPYHRIPFFYPNVEEIGYARVGRFHVFDFGSKMNPDAAVTVLSPYPGAAYVPVSWDGNEIPDPLRIHENAQYPTGYPIMAGIYGKNVKETAITNAEVTDDAGKSVPLLWNSAGNMNKDDELNTEVMVVPTKPLEPGHTYTVKLQLLVTNKDDTQKIIDKTWQFTTEKKEGIGSQILHNTSSAKNDQRLINRAVSHQLKFTLDGSDYEVDGRRFQAIVKPMIFDGYSYLALRDMEKALDAKLDWDDSTKTAIFRKGDRTVAFSTLQNKFTVNGENYQTDTPAKLIQYNGEPRTIIPVRLLSESLGAKVDYIDATRTVVITY